MINGQDYEYIGRYKCPLLYYRLVHQWVNHKDAARYSIDSRSEGRSLFLDGHMFVNKKDWETMRSQTAYALLNEDSVFFNEFHSFGNAEIERVSHASDPLASAGPLDPELFAEFFRALQDMQFPWMLTLPIGDAIESSIKSLLKKGGISPESVQQFFEPEKPTQFIEQRRELYLLKQRLENGGLLETLTASSPTAALAAIREKDSDLYDSLREHAKRFEWFGMMHMWGTPFNEEGLIREIINLKEKPLSREKTTPLPPGLEWLKQQSRKMTYLRNTFAETCAIASHKSLPAIERAASHLGLTLDETRHLTPEELLEGLKGNRLPSRDSLHDRMDAFGLILHDGKSVLMTGKELHNQIGSLLPQESPETLTGTCASLGMAKGRVKLVFSPADMNKVEKGDIVVAPETTPDLLPIFHKAGGIITDMGGITGHAAIVSREFGLPCIVGTRDATRVLKDNDVIELDATNGVIRKIAGRSEKQA